MRGSTVSQEKLMEGIFGKPSLSSNYEWMAAEVETTPDQMSWWHSRKQNTRDAIMLIENRVTCATVMKSTDCGPQLCRDFSSVIQL